MTKKRVATLLRLSSKVAAKRQSGGDLDVPAQRAEIAKFLATRPDWLHTKDLEFLETGSAYSRRSRDRDIIQQVLDAAEEGRFDVLVAWRADRISRRLSDLPAVVEDLAECGVETWTVADETGGKYLSAKTAMDLFMLSVHGLKSQSESEAISLRTTTRKRQLAAEARWHGGRVPYGYRLEERRDHEGKTVYRNGRPVRDLHAHSDHAPVVARIFSLYTEGNGAQAIAGLLNAEGIPSPKGALWASQVVRGILRNPLYAGIIHAGRTRHWLKRTKHPFQAPIIAQGTHPPLVDRALWDECQTLMAGKARLARRQRDATTHPFSGALRCGKCTGAMGGAVFKYNSPTGTVVYYEYYRCLVWQRSKTCSGKMIRADTIERSFLDAIERQLFQPSNLRELLELTTSQEQARRKAAGDAKKRAAAQIDTIKQALVKLNRSYFEVGNITDDEYTELKRQYNDELEQWQRILNEPAQDAGQVDISDLLERARLVREVWDDMTAGEKRAFIVNLSEAYGIVPYVDQTGHVEFRLQEGEDSGKLAH